MVNQQKYLAGRYQIVTNLAEKEEKYYKNVT